IYLSAQKELGIEQSILSEKCSEILENISLISRVDSDGKLMEWSRNTEEAEKGHRHLSHLYGVFPGEVFCSEQNMMSAARRSLDFRMSNGSGYTGWSAAWAQCLYAVFGDGLMAYECLQKLWESSTLPNLFDTCNDVFQIDGNLGAAAGIIEMLVQSRNGKIDILPALPEVWQNGSIYGVKLRGGGEIEIHWKDGFLTGYSITGMNNNPVYYKGKRIDEKNL
ncbi:MAG: glycoside hydrolase family 95 protein, partial [Clostridia bacterium]|nr:glycoside hydrolase family 95 protein [Clostridia bacterium]